MKTRIVIQYTEHNLEKAWPKLKDIEVLPLEYSRLSVTKVYKKGPDEFNQHFICIEGESRRLTAADYEELSKFIKALQRYFFLSITQDEVLPTQAHTAFWSVWPYKKQQ